MVIKIKIKIDRVKYEICPTGEHNTFSSVNKTCYSIPSVSNLHNVREQSYVQFGFFSFLVCKQRLPSDLIWAEITLL